MTSIDQVTIGVIMRNSTHQTNMTDYYGDYGTDAFFEKYFSAPRLVTEATVAALAASLNVGALVVIPNARHRFYRQHIYHMLFMNLALTNVLACIVQFLSNNVFYFFGTHMSDAVSSGGTTMCEIFSYVGIAAFLSISLGVVSMLTMLGFSSVQYIAIRKPLHHSSIVRKSRVLVFILCCWLVCLMSATVLLVYVCVVSSREECDQDLASHIADVIVTGSKASVGIVATIYSIIIIICIRLYVDIHLMRRRLSCHRHESVNTERRTFITTLILLGTFTAFFIPFTVVYLLSLRSDSDYSHQTGLIFYMNLLPYLKFLSDPIIYGIRMRGMRTACGRIGGACGGCACVKRDGHKNTFVTSQNSYPSTNYSLQPISTV